VLPASLNLIVTVYRMISPAPPYAVSLEAGAWLALVAALGIIVGAWNGTMDEGPIRRSPGAERRAAAEAFAATQVLALSGAGGEAHQE
jgi:hypothetical protein